MKVASKQKFLSLLDEYDRTQKTYITMSALHTLAKYWVENEIIIERAAAEEAELNGPKWRPDPDDQDSVGEYFSERDAARDLHDRTLIPMHRYSCIVMIYSTVERELLRLVENLNKENGPQVLEWKEIRGSKVEQIARFCEAFFRVRLKDCDHYESMTILQKIRDCIIHCLGDVGLSADKVFLVKLKRQGLWAYPNNPIEIGPECIKQFLVEIWAFFVSVFGALAWEIAPHWQGNKLEKTFEKLKG